MTLLLVEHRVNTIEHLRQIPSDRGVEIDVRDYDGDLVLAHDPLQAGEPLDRLLDEYRHAMLIVNVKCDGLEREIAARLAARGIDDYFLLDCANPTLVGLVRSGMRRVAVRYSEFEPVELALAFAGLAEWVWVDCFDRLPLDAGSHALLREHFKICVVSPELQGHPKEEIARYREALATLPVDAVCTDLCDEWEGR